MKKIFISHKRYDGQASTEAILIHNILVKQPGVNVFMEVSKLIQNLGI